MYIPNGEVTKESKLTLHETDKSRQQMRSWT
jgi:hypothetical protein